eukprot:scaffold885_cov381-Prasinococcus_capsulatus_cf.AAC.10
MAKLCCLSYPSLRRTRKRGPTCTRCLTVCGERLSIASGWKCCVESLLRTCVGVLVCAYIHVRSFACEAGCTSMPVIRAGRTRCNAAVQASCSSPRALSLQHTNLSPEHCSLVRV